MIGKLKLWTSDIIIAVVISIIIEMIIPDGNNKKYVKVVSGLYILFVILNPFLDVKNKLNLIWHQLSKQRSYYESKTSIFYFIIINSNTIPERDSIRSIIASILIKRIELVHVFKLDIKAEKKQTNVTI